MKDYPKSHLLAASLLGVMLLGVVVSLPAEPESARPIPLAVTLENIKPLPIPAPEQATMPAELTPAPAAAPAVEWTNVTVRPGDSLARIFARLGLSATTLHEALSAGDEARSLKRIIPGKTLAFQIGEDNELLGLRYQRSPLETLSIVREEDQFTTRIVVTEPEVITNYSVAFITPETPSLYHAGKKAGLSDNLIMELANIFQWDISFALDLRDGDSFTLIFEELYVDGEKIKEGDILGATFNNMGTQHTALLYEQDGIRNYFTPDGRSLRKAFIRDPVHFSHVSSSFNLRRLHPIHKRVMPHRGIDYAAKRGTPVVAAGDGTVQLVTRNQASGNFVVIQHGEQYTTKYLHLSGFARGMRAGKKVGQGDVIGYVGATGWATAPHLHYEFLVNGVHRNPRTVKLPKAEPIVASNRPHFDVAVAPMVLRLDSLNGNTAYAQSESTGANDG